ncbi:elongation factor G-binding protein [Bacillus sp. FJAT-42376]|uniref:FusB/FusC family EF-G-binding protein n=1 Tax=Bacillus sp. FJAT-42376 TaxID=2014076 RepID=UPI000F4D8946|nr:FusB/FusC family EF-G-binding protein [Bacillus sp. FJAT-42376]AZB41862.1 elongation factor G-binding protein [Bacillus sp. FJAT-42376]
MEPFIRTDQYQFIKSQAYSIVNGHATANHQGVLKAVKEMAREQVLRLAKWTDEQRRLLEPVYDIKDRGDAELYAAAIKSYVIPFREVGEPEIKKLFPKAKKLKAPALDEVDLKEIIYLSWKDKGSDKMFLIAPYQGKLKGLHGTFNPLHKKSICTICGGHQEVGLFMTQVKGTAQGTFVKRGNYICSDSLQCSQHIKSLDRLEDFFGLMS